MLEREGREREGKGTRNRTPETGPIDSFGKHDTYINGSEPISDETVRRRGNFSPSILSVNMTHEVEISAYETFVFGSSPCLKAVLPGSAMGSLARPALSLPSVPHGQVP